jgi:hypothetical protein
MGDAFARVYFCSEGTSFELAGEYCLYILEKKRGLFLI